MLRELYFDGFSVISHTLCVRLGLSVALTLLTGQNERRWSGLRVYRDTFNARSGRCEGSYRTCPREYKE